MKKILNNESNSIDAIGTIEKIKKFIGSEVTEAISLIKKKENENIEYIGLKNLLTIKTNISLKIYMMNFLMH